MVSPSKTRRSRPSISQAVSSFSESYGVSPLAGRSYIYRAPIHSHQRNNSLTVHSNTSLHEETAELASVGVPDVDDSESDNGELHMSVGYPDVDETDSLMVKSDSSKAYAATDNFDDMSPDVERYGTSERVASSISFIGNLFHALQNKNAWRDGLKTTVSSTPAVFLGLLLNILDGLSYGMIMFPIGETMFSHLGPAGLSMFYLSCVVSQLVYSLGGSAFPSAIGSEMIEVTPFFHSMAISIMKELGGSDGVTNKDVILSTTFFAFALSSIVTGAVFYILGKCKLGSLVGFFPRHILVGCIGGVGYFLVVTAIEVSSRLEGGISYNWVVFDYLFGNITTLLQWTVPLMLSVLLVLIQLKFHNALVVPSFFLAVFFVFHLVIFLTPSLTLVQAQESGWVFQSPPSNEPWYAFYDNYNIVKVDWWCILLQVPKVLALTFFGILHVPINVPALAVSVGMDEFDVDRELVAHGVSNALAGVIGSIQNYLTYTNSILFIRAGGDSRVSGVLLAIATAAVMMAGPGVIGYIPVCVVGSLIYLLGYELLKESVYDTIGKVRKFEYITVIIIVITMGAWDFVYGILVGILLACVSFVIENARRPVISGIFSGDIARSTVLRHPKQQEFLSNVGNQIYVLKLQGSLFFGSIGGLEKKVRERFDLYNFEKQPIRYLILDMKSVLTLDFSAAEGLKRIRNLVNEKKSFLIISSVQQDDDVVKSLKNAGLWSCEEDEERIQLFGDLNSALEWCENIFLKTYSDLKTGDTDLNDRSASQVSIPKNPPTKKRTPNMAVFEGSAGSPRNLQVLREARRVVSDEARVTNAFINSGSDKPTRVLSLVLTILQSLSAKDAKFWMKLIPYLEKQVLPASTPFYNSTCKDQSFFFVESGLIKVEYDFEQGKLNLESSILPLTAFGSILANNSQRSANYVTTNETVVWRLSSKKMELLEKENPDVYHELIIISMKLLVDRFHIISSSLLVST